MIQHIQTRQKNQAGRVFGNALILQSHLFCLLNDFFSNRFMNQIRSFLGTLWYIPVALRKAVISTAVVLKLRSYKQQFQAFSWHTHTVIMTILFIASKTTYNNHEEWNTLFYKLTLKGILKSGIESSIRISKDSNIVKASSPITVMNVAICFQVRFFLCAVIT